MGDMLIRAWREGMRQFAGELAKSMPKPTDPVIAETTRNPHPDVITHCKQHGVQWCTVCWPTKAKPVAQQSDSLPNEVPVGARVNPSYDIAHDDPLNDTGPGELVVHFGPRGGLIGVTMHGVPLPFTAATHETGRFPGPDLRPIVVRRAEP
jgi:hypothetical protein